MHPSATRLMVGISVAIPAASLCINRRLYIIATSQTATTSFAHVGLFVYRLIHFSLFTEKEGCHGRFGYWSRYPGPPDGVTCVI